MRRFLHRTRYLRMRELTLRLQSIARKKVAQAQLKSLREEKAATSIQTCWRRYTARKAYLFQQQFVLRLQTAIRGMQARSKLGNAREHNAAIQIQSLVRGWYVSHSRGSHLRFAINTCFRFARKHYNAQRQFIIHLQSCVRRRTARKQLILLRSEARSAHHLKEVSYKLENKIVELTQTLTGLKDEKKAAMDRSTQLEAQIRTWMEKYEKLERRSKGYEAKLQEPTVPQEEYEALKKEKQGVQTELKASQDKVKAQERELSQMAEQLKTQKEENEKIRAELEEANEKVKNATDEGEVAELKSQVAAMKAQLSQVLHQPRRQQSSTNATSGTRGLSPNPPSFLDERSLSPGPITSKPASASAAAASAAATSGPTTPSGAPAPASAVSALTESNQARENAATRKSKIPTGLPKKSRRNSTADMPANRVKTSIDVMRQAERLTRSPRPTSMHQFGSMKAMTEPIGDNPGEEVRV